MPLGWLQPPLDAFRGGRARNARIPAWLHIVCGLWMASLAVAMTPDRVAELRRETVDMFYHGFDNYMNIAFPDDELRPVTCAPLTRDNKHPDHIALNDVLGNYSLTLIDSLSTLAILASSPPEDADIGKKALRDFQDGVELLVRYYGDGRPGSSGRGIKARGFDLDSKVQVFETVIRGLGGLLSAHLFASGTLPINGYHPSTDDGAISWPNGFVYDGQLLRLALDLGQRLLPAFYTATGLPYPRVNLRHGIPFYQNSPLNQAVDDCVTDGQPEITETCSAGAGSLVLEFTTLSRLTGDHRFEQLGKRAFWAVWNRRSPIGLIGNGVDAEEGHWIGAYSGIGAGVDSFFEYALKTHILLSGHDVPNMTAATTTDPTWLDPNTLYAPLTLEENSPDAFLSAWLDAHAAIKRHLYSNAHHPHYVNAHLSTGSPQAYWIDSLGAYYPGLLTLAGELDEAIETNLLYTALWTRYAALPERWSVRDGHVEGGLGWWPGRPEFIESNYHIYRATGDPWYLHVGEMVVKDIKQRCWTQCGWAGLQDVRTGEKSDRMESFFLGETTKYLYLLFDPSHPLNSLDAPFVFTTEGHPLLIPRSTAKAKHDTALKPLHFELNDEFCPAPPPLIPLTTSATAARDDIFHAASLTGLHHVPNMRVSLGSGATATLTYPNHTYYPWTLPTSLIPADASCAQIPLKTTFTIEFPSNTQVTPANGFNIVFGGQTLVRTDDGILVKSLSSLKLGLVLDEVVPGDASASEWRIWSIGNIPLGRDEKIFIARDTMGAMADPSFTRVRDPILFDLLVKAEVPSPAAAETNHSMVWGEMDYEEDYELELDELDDDLATPLQSAGLAAEYRTMLSSLLRQVTSALRDPAATLMPRTHEPPPVPTYAYVTLPAIAPTGPGAAPLPNVDEASHPRFSPPTLAGTPDLDLAWRKLYFAGEACDAKLPTEAATAHHIIVMRRGGCTFSEKLARVPSFAPSARAVQLVVVISDDEARDGAFASRAADSRATEPLAVDADAVAQYALVSRPLLDAAQLTPAGVPRRHPLALAMVGGGRATEELLRTATAVGLRRRYHVESQGRRIANLIVV